jgi:ketosteroid isomerase-like protein
MSANQTSQREKDIKDMLDILESFRTGWEKSDPDQILSTIAQQDEVVIYGTDLVERWIGYEAFVDPVFEQVKALVDPVYTWGENEPRINVQGDIGWASGDLNVAFEMEGVPQEVSMRSTYVLSRQGGEWKIVQAHFSVGEEQAVVEY